MSEATKAEWVKVYQRLDDLARLARAASEGNEQAVDDLRSERIPCGQYVGRIAVDIEEALASMENDLMETRYTVAE